jgi:hypothetical protein
VSTQGKEVVIGEEWPLRMIKPKSPKDGQWKKNDGGKLQCHPKATFDILMAKYKEGRTDIRGAKIRPSGISNRTVRFPWVRLAILQLGAYPTKDLGLHCIKIQKTEIVVSKSIIQHLISQSGC